MTLLGDTWVAAVLSGLAGGLAPGILPPFDATQAANWAGGTTSTAIGM